MIGNKRSYNNEKPVHRNERVAPTHHNERPSAAKSQLTNYKIEHAAFSVVQLSHSYMTTGKNIALTRWTFVGKVISAF